MGKRNVKKPDVCITTYEEKSNNGRRKTVITFRNGVDEFIDAAYVNITVTAGNMYFTPGNIDSGGVKLTHSTHSIQNSSTKLQDLLYDFNGEYPMNIDDDNKCFISLLERVPGTEPKPKPKAKAKEKASKKETVKTPAPVKEPVVKPEVKPEPIVQPAENPVPENVDIEAMIDALVNKAISNGENVQFEDIVESVTNEVVNNVSKDFNTDEIDNLHETVLDAVVEADINKLVEEREVKIETEIEQPEASFDIIEDKTNKKEVEDMNNSNPTTEATTNTAKTGITITSDEAAAMKSLSALLAPTMMPSQAPLFTALKSLIDGI